MKRLCLTLLLLLAPLAAAAQFYPDYESTTVNDFAGLIPEEQEAAISQQLTELRNDTGVEMTVVTLSRQDTFDPDASFEAFATGLFNHWGIGDKDKNNGIMVLVMHSDRVMRIELGSGYGNDWDSAAKQVIDRSFLPAFKNNNYAGGITAGVTDAIETIARPAAEGSEPPKGDGIGGAWPLLAMGLFGGLFFFGRRIGDFFGRFRTCPTCGSRGTLRTSRKVLHRATKASAGSGRRTVVCSNCDYHNESMYTISRISSSGGSSSFGGGSSSGGGASGRW